MKTELSKNGGLQINVGLAKKIDTALSTLTSVGFQSSLTSNTYQLLAESFNAATLHLAFALCDILLEEKPLTVRRGLYRCASQGLVEGTGDSCYNQVQRLILLLRRKGFIPYSWISDSTRSREKPSSWSGLQDFADTASQAYRKDLWSQQKWHIEVFTEKDAMTGVLAPITRKYDIHLNVIRGQVSDSFAWNVAEEWQEIEKPIRALYFGDHDPAGLKIEASLKSRIQGFLPSYHRPQWRRIAVDDFDFGNDELLGLKVKTGDRAGRAYIEEYGDRCVEVDAISSNEIRERLEAEITEVLDMEAWEKLQATEKLEKETVKGILSNIRKQEAAQ
jgi:hypothetical protein